MTTDQIITLADPGNQAGPDLDLGLFLRHKILPEFLFDVRGSAWRRARATLTFTAVRTMDAPVDLDSVVEIMKADGTRLTYIGEDPLKVAAALLDTTPGTPIRYWVDSPGSDTTHQHAIVLNCIPAAPVTYSLSYLKGINWSDTSTALSLDGIIPQRMQWALVEGVKRELWRERAGVGDQRFIAAAKEFEDWKARAGVLRELGPAGDLVKSVR